jgi:arabinogalactan oligomer / maltooligosaccharide transport system substrate-binding protein/arabinogalactan oligomer / maltooligosaccharide transport system permease protein
MMTTRGCLNSRSICKTILLFFSYLCVSMSLCLSFSACAKSSLEDPHQIVIWHTLHPDEQEMFAEILQKYMDQNPGIKITALYKETETLRSGFQIAAIGGAGPDIVWGPSDQVGPFEAMQIILPLDTLFSREYLSKFNPKALVYSHGHLYSIADKIGNHLMLIYNKSLLPNPPKTMDELIAVGQKFDEVTNGHALVWNYTEPYFFIPFLTGFGGWVMDSLGNPTLDTPAMVKALKFMKDLRDKYQIIPKSCDYETADALFKEGKAEMIINGPWAFGSYKNAGVSFGVARIPFVEETGLWPAPMVSPMGYSINASIPSWKIPEVVKFLKYLLSPEVQLEFTKHFDTIPTRVEVYDDSSVQSNEIVKGAEDEMEVGRPMPIVPELRAIWDAMRPSYQAVLGGTETPEQAAKEMQRSAIQKIKEMNE